MGGGFKEVMNRLKGLVKGIFDKVLDVGKWIAGGFSRFYEGIPKFTVPDFPKEAPEWIPDAGKFIGWGREKLYEVFTDGIKLLIGPLSGLMGKELPNLLWLLNPMNTTPLLIKSFFPPKGAKEGGGSKEGADSTSVKPATKGDQK